MENKSQEQQQSSDQHGGLFDALEDIGNRISLPPPPPIPQESSDDADQLKSSRKSMASTDPPTPVTKDAKDSLEIVDGADDMRSSPPPRDRPKTPHSYNKHKEKHNYKVKAGNVASENWKDMLRWRASVLPSIIIPTFIIAVWTALVTVFYMVPSVNFLSGRIPNSALLITVLGVVMGLLLVFRTNTSYDRFWEGRRIWSVVLTQLRNLSRMIWINVVAKTPAEAAQKRAAMNLIIAFPAALKHYLRFEYGYEWDDLGPYLAHLPEYSPERETLNTNKNIPIDITLYLQAYVAKCRKTEAIDVPTQGAMTTVISTLIDSLSGFERIRDSPIPLAYSIHLKQTLVVYLLSLPFQLVPSIYWGTIPAVTIASFTLLGIEAIGGQIENPFGYDENDLPQDIYVNDIREEIVHLMRNCEKEDDLVSKYDTANWVEPFSDLSVATFDEAVAKEERLRNETAINVVSSLNGAAGGK